MGKYVQNQNQTKYSDYLQPTMNQQDLTFCHLIDLRIANIMKYKAKQQGNMMVFKNEHSEHNYIHKNCEPTKQL